MRTLTILLSLLIAMSASAEDLGKRYADQAWDMWDRLEQCNEIEGDSWKKVIELFKEAATFGCKDVYNGIGYIYQHHASVLEADMPADYAALIEDYYNQAIANGSTQAIYNLATCYYYGDAGFEKNFNKALSLYRMGANQGNAFCLTQLGLLYKDRSMPSIDKYPEAAAFECFSKAYENKPENCPAICSLAECYEKVKVWHETNQKHSLCILKAQNITTMQLLKQACSMKKGALWRKTCDKA